MAEPSPTPPVLQGVWWPMALVQERTGVLTSVTESPVLWGPRSTKSKGFWRTILTWKTTQ